MGVRQLVASLHPALFKPTMRVKDFNDPQFRALIQDLRDTLDATGGVGLSANQVGAGVRVCLIKPPDWKTAWVMVNPKIVARRGERVVREGCLSLPNRFASLRRSLQIRVRWQDEAGKEYRSRESGVLAHIIEHEVDHLRGVLSLLEPSLVVTPEPP